MSSSYPHHSCTLCEPAVSKLVAEITATDSLGFHIRRDNSRSIPLADLQQVYANSNSCAFFDFVRQLHGRSSQHAIDGIELLQDSDYASRVRVTLNHVDFQSHLHGRRRPCSAYVEFTEPSTNSTSAYSRREAFRLLVDDVECIGYDAYLCRVGLGRALSTDEVKDDKFLKTCFNSCLSDHRGCEALPHPIVKQRSVHAYPRWRKERDVPMHRSLSVQSPPRTMRVVDVWNDMICPMPQNCKYVAMSYVWGPSYRPTFSQTKLSEFFRSGSLDVKSLPKSIQHAILVTRALNQQYLWIDSMCIAQDDPNEVDNHVVSMHMIYANARLTIVDARSNSVDGGLWPEEPRNQLIGEGGGLRWVAAAPTLGQAISGSPWSTRGWTYQEAVFSKRLLVFGSSLVYFSCARSACAEDYIHLIHKSPYSQDFECRFPETAEGEQGTVGRFRNFPPSFAALVSDYTRRHLTLQKDALRACHSILTSYLAAYRDIPMCGLPASMLFEHGLMWTPQTTLQRRQVPDHLGNFTTWSWAGWVGGVTYCGYAATDDKIRQHVLGARIIHSWSLNLSKDPWFGDREDTNSLRQLEKGQIQSEDLDLLFSEVTQQPWMDTVRQVLPKLLICSLRFKAKTIQSLNVGDEPWARLFGSKDSACEHTGLYKLFNPEGSWVGAVHFEHRRWKDFCGMRNLIEGELLFIALSTSGGLGPWAAHPLDGPEPGSTIFDPKFTREGTEVYNVMAVVRCGPMVDTYERLGVGQVHQDSFDGLDVNEREIELV